MVTGEFTMVTIVVPFFGCNVLSRLHQAYGLRLETCSEHLNITCLFEVTCDTMTIQCRSRSSVHQFITTKISYQQY